MSQYARNNPDLPPIFDVFAGTRRGAKSHEEKIASLQAGLAAHKAREAEIQRELGAKLCEARGVSPQRDYVPGSSNDPAHGSW